MKTSAKAMRKKIPAWNNIGLGVISSEERCRHLIAFGESGSGKTESVIKPTITFFLLEDRFIPGQQKNPALIIDPKGELKPVLTAGLHGQDEELVDFADDDSRLWRFDENTAKQSSAWDIVEEIMNIFPDHAGNSSADSFWENSARAMLATIIQIELTVYRASGNREDVKQFWCDFIRYCQSNKKNEHDRLQAFTSQTYFDRLVAITRFVSYEIQPRKDATAAGFFSATDEDSFRTGWRFLRAFLTKQQKTLGIRFSPDIFSRIQNYRHAPTDTYKSITTVLDTMVRPLQNPTLQRKVSLDPFCRPDNQLNPGDLITSGSLVQYAPSGNPNEAEDAVGRMLKEAFFSELLIPERLKQPNIPIFYYICDEFQRYITMDPYSGEQSFLDRCRAYNVSCILATQSTVSLQYACAGVPGNRGDYAVKVMLSNIGNKLFFRSTDQETTNSLKTNIPHPAAGPHIIDVRPLAELEVGQCYSLLSNGTFARGKVILER